MKKEIMKKIGLLIFIAIVTVAIVNIYYWIVSGKQYIKINTSNKAYSNSDLYVSIVAQKDNVDLETKTKLKLTDSKGKKVKGVKVKNEENGTILSIPEIEGGNYFLEAKVSSKAGRDKIKKEIYISDGNSENVTITMDKGIYKPGDTVNYRALLTNKENDAPVSKDVEVSIYDGNENKVYSENVKSSDYGIISGSFTLADEVNSGMYKLTVKVDDNETVKQFKVNPYVTPKYEVKVNYDKENYLVGETAKITFNTKYFFGEGAQNTDLTVYINNEEYTKLKTDEQGNATMDYEIKDAKKHEVKVEAVDSSNYYVETTSNFTAGTDIFEIQLLPEYGTLAAGKKNDVYVFTKKADGTPLKAYVAVTSNNFTKQIATDENGVGKFSIDINETKNNSSNYYKEDNTKTFAVKAEDTNGNNITKRLNLKIENKDLLLTTDKVKYEQGEDIKLNVSSTIENAKNIYFFKNDKLVKMLNTDSSDTTINLDDTYGLIDIYVTEKAKGEGFKKTIFIKPSKKLNININTDKEEYKPGEKINISFNATDENKTGVDAALLVSMLDNSILNLANNDLSIDNIKLALQDIKFSDELDAATLYSSIVEDSSEQEIMALLLKQSDRDINASSESVERNREQEQKSMEISIISLAIIIIIVFVFLCVKFETFRYALKHIINFIMYDLLLFTIILCVGEELDLISNNSIFWTFILTTLAGLAIYIIYAYKLMEKTFKTSLSIIITYLLFLLMVFLIEGLSVSPILIGLIVVGILLILIVLAKIAEIKGTDKYMEILVKVALYILKFVGTLAISIFIGAISSAIIKIYGIEIPVTIISVYLLNYLFNERIRKEKTHREPRNVALRILIILAIIGILAIGSFITMIFNSAKGVLNSNQLSGYDYYGTNSGRKSSGAPNPNNYIGAEAEVDSADNGFGMSSVLGGLGDALTEGSSIVGDLAKQQETNDKTDSTEQTQETTKEEAETVVDDNVRNVFLESMCFVPGLLTTKGTAKLDLDLSDNITTWTIQTVGNTKDGKIGYGKKDNVKVFKDFFVDFELPKNLVETDNVSIPVTVYNYTESPISTTLKIAQQDWFTIENDNININVEAKSTSMTYVPITVLKAGDNKFRAEITSNGATDIVEKECTVSTKGYKVEKVVSTGNLDQDISEDILFLDDTIENTSKAKIKIYPSTISQTVEGMENIFAMPTGCFEQISSSLYPNILALKYLEESGTVDEEIRSKAISYISSGYQKLLTYEVKGESGGYSLYGDSPAETVLTAYGLMEVKDLSEVYNVDNSVIEEMTNYLYGKQNANGTFTITGSHIGGANSREELSLNAYITWALSESDPKDGRIKKSVEYLKGKLDDVEDNYTLALIANTLANVEDGETKDVLKRLVNNTETNGNSASITSNIPDYYGSRSNTQTVQTIALTSIALSKTSYNTEVNKALINNLISKKDTMRNLV